MTNKTRVFMIDDSMFVLSMIEGMLEGTEFAVVGTATTGKKGITQCNDLKPDIVLLDIVLPDRLGSDIITDLVKMDPRPSVIMVSSLGTQGKVVECLKKGASHFITKPFEQAVLLETLREYKQQGRVPLVKPSLNLSLASMNLGMKFFEIHVGMKFFGQHLMEKGLINKEQLLDAIEHQRKINKTIEQICVEKGLLSKPEIQRVHEIQKADLDKEFNEIVLLEGFMTKTDLDKVIEEYQKNWTYLGEALVKTRALSYNQLAEMLKEYREDQEKDGWEIGTKLASVKNNLIVKTFVNFTMKIFHKIIKEPVKLKECADGIEHFKVRNYTIQQKLRGDMVLYFVVNIADDIALRICNALFGKEITEIGDMEIDALKEFLNVISGNCCSKLSNIGINIETTPPEFYDNRKEVQYTLPQKMQNAIALVISGIGDFDLLIMREH
ncbi:MAG: response regulator [bacterium]